MNGTEQQARHVAVQRAESRLDTLETVLSALVDEVRKEREARLRADGEERTQRIRLALEQRSYVDTEDRLLRACCQDRWDVTMATTKRLFDAHAAFRGRTFWQRLRWLVRGF